MKLVSYKEYLISESIDETKTLRKNLDFVFDKHKIALKKFYEQYIVDFNFHEEEFIPDNMSEFLRDLNSLENFKNKLHFLINNDGDPQFDAWIYYATKKNVFAVLDIIDVDYINDKIIKDFSKNKFKIPLIFIEPYLMRSYLYRKGLGFKEFVTLFKTYIVHEYVHFIEDSKSNFVKLSNVSQIYGDENTRDFPTMLITVPIIHTFIDLEINTNANTIQSILKSSYGLNKENAIKLLKGDLELMPKSNKRLYKKYLYNSKLDLNLIKKVLSILKLKEYTNKGVLKKLQESPDDVKIKVREIIEKIEYSYVTVYPQIANYITLYSVLPETIKLYGEVIKMMPQTKIKYEGYKKLLKAAISSINTNMG